MVSDIRNLIKLIKTIRPECAQFLANDNWIAQKITTDIPNLDIEAARAFVENKLAYENVTITVPVLMNWLKRSQMKWTKEKEIEKDKYFGE